MYLLCKIHTKHSAIAFQALIDKEIKGTLHYRYELSILIHVLFQNHL